MTESKKPPRPGSARAKLEAFERSQKGRRSLQTRMIVIFAMIAVILVVQFLLSQVGEDREWFEVPKDAAWQAREGKLEDLEKRFAADLEVEGIPGLTREDLITQIRQRSSGGLGAFATQPHEFGKVGDRRWVKFWLIYSRGDLRRRGTIPLVRTWHVYAELEKDGGEWLVKKLDLREAVSPGGGAEMEGPETPR